MTWRNDGAVLIRVARRERTGATWRDLESAKVVSRKNEFIRVGVILEDDSVAEFLDPENWTMQAVRKAYDHVVGEELLLIKKQGEWLSLQNLKRLTHKLNYQSSKVHFRQRILGGVMGISREVFDSRIQKNDEQGIVGFTQKLVDDLEAGFQAINDTLFPWLEKLSKRKFRGVLCLGMGGSAAGGLPCYTFQT